VLPTCCLSIVSLSSKGARASETKHHHHHHNTHPFEQQRVKAPPSCAGLMRAMSLVDVSISDVDLARYTTTSTAKLHQRQSSSTARKLESAVNMRGYILFCSVVLRAPKSTKGPFGWWALLGVGIGGAYLCTCCHGC
jgi:hypothetical protein